MKISYAATGDLLGCPEPVLIHGCNAQGRFAAGVAAAIRMAHAFAFEAYFDAYERGELRLGEVVWAFNLVPHAPTPRIIGNVITQSRYGREPGVRYIDYDALARGITRVDQFAESSQNGTIDIGSPIEAVAMPRIGAGLGGGDWEVISAIIEQHSPHFRPVVYVPSGQRSLPA